MQNIIKQLDARNPNFRYGGGLCQLAAALQKKRVGPFLGSLSLGELRNVLRLAVGQRSLLRYDVMNGGKLVKSPVCFSSTPTPTSSPSRAAPRMTPPPVAKPSPSLNMVAPASTFGPPPGLDLMQPTSNVSSLSPPPLGLGFTSAEDMILANLRSQPLPEAFGSESSDPEVRKRCRVLKSCVESLYRDRIQPTLAEVQQRLRNRGWTSDDIQGVLPLCAREAGEYKLELPANGQPLRVLLRNPPAWFDGWLSGDSAAFSPEVWTAMANFLKSDCTVLTGTINGAAQDLRQLSLPLPLQELSLGELREVVRHAVAEHSLLSYSGWSLCPTQAMLRESSADEGLETETGRRHFAQI